MPNQDKHITEW